MADSQRMAEIASIFAVGYRRLVLARDQARRLRAWASAMSRRTRISRGSSSISRHTSSPFANLRALCRSLRLARTLSSTPSGRRPGAPGSRTPPLADLGRCNQVLVRQSPRGSRSRPTTTWWSTPRTRRGGSRTPRSSWRRSWSTPRTARCPGSRAFQLRRRAGLGAGSRICGDAATMGRRPLRVLCVKPSNELVVAMMSPPCTSRGRATARPNRPGLNLRLAGRDAAGVFVAFRAFPAQRTGSRMAEAGDVAS